MAEHPATVYRRAGKHPVRPNDIVRVAPAVFTVSGISIRDRGWSGAKVLRFVPEGSRPVLAEVTVPGRAGTRTIRADRLTKTRGGQQR